MRMPQQSTGSIAQRIPEGGSGSVRAVVVLWSRDPVLAGQVESAAVEAGGRVEGVRLAREFVGVMLPQTLPHEVEEVPRVAVVDAMAGADVAEVVRELLGVRPALKVIVVGNGVVVGGESSWRQMGVFFVMPRAAAPALLGRVLRKAVEHETTRWSRGAADA